MKPAGLLFPFITAVSKISPETFVDDRLGDRQLGTLASRPEARDLHRQRRRRLQSYQRT